MTLAARWSNPIASDDRQRAKFVGTKTERYNRRPRTVRHPLTSYAALMRSMFVSGV